MKKKSTVKSVVVNLGNLNVQKPGPGGAIYGLGVIGALVYYITTATSLWMGILGVLKSIFWPAFLVYGALKFLGM